MTAAAVRQRRILFLHLQISRLSSNSQRFYAIQPLNADIIRKETTEQSESANLHQGQNIITEGIVLHGETYHLLV